MNELEFERTIVAQTTLLYMLEHEKALIQMLIVLQSKIAIHEAVHGAGGE